ncbi:MAG: carboxylate--amine ligase [Solirubrobacteraceae bacterium]
MTAARVVVTDAGRGSAIAVMRSLGRRGVHVVAADHDPRSPGFRSRYVARRLLYPDPLSSPGAVVDLLHAEAAAGRIDLVVPVSDEVLLPLARQRERFAGLCALAIPDDRALAQVVDKAATLELARRVGVPVPRTAIVHSAAAAAAAAPELGWPVVLKPAVSRMLHDGAVDRFEVTYADTPAALAEAMAPLEGRCPVLLQEHVPGEGHGVELLLDHGRTLIAFQHRRLHEVPITGGASALREGVPVEPEMLDHAQRLLGALDWTGLAMVEFRVGASGPVLMEVNGRIWGSLPLAVRSGADFPLGLAQLYLGSRLNGAAGGPASVPAPGVRSRNLSLELVWIASVLGSRRRYPYLDAPRRRDGLTAALRLALPGDGFDVLSRDDPAPGISDAARAVGHLLRKVRNA